MYGHPGQDSEMDICHALVYKLDLYVLYRITQAFPPPITGYSVQADQTEHRHN